MFKNLRQPLIFIIAVVAALAITGCDEGQKTASAEKKPAAANSTGDDHAGHNHAEGDHSGHDHSTDPHAGHNHGRELTAAEKATPENKYADRLMAINGKESSDQAKIQAEVAALRQAPQPNEAKISKLMIDSVALSNSAIKELKGVTPPASLRKFHTALVTGKEKMTSVVQEVNGAMSSKDQKKIDAVQKRLQTTFDQFSEDLKREVEAAGFDFEMFSQSMYFVKKG